MKKIELTGLFLILLFGCATAPAPRQEGSLTSEPAGAHVQIIEEETGNIYYLGRTPLNFWVRQEKPMVLNLELEEYLPVKIALPPEGNVSRHITLKKDPAPQIREELPTYPKELINAALEVVGECEKTLKSPPSGSGDPRSELEKLQIHFPQYRQSALVKELGKAVSYTQKRGSDIVQPRRFETNPGTQIGFGEKAWMAINKIHRQLGLEASIKAWSPPY